MMRLGLAGPTGSGKDTIGDYLAERHSFTHISTSDLLRQEADRLSLDHEQATLQRLGAELRQRYGYKRLFGDTLENTVGKTVFTGIRTIGAAQLFEHPQGLLVYIDAPLEVRYDHFIARGRGTPMTFLEFALANRIEHTGSNSTDMALDRIRSMAHYIIENSGTLEQLHEKVDAMVASL